MFKFLKLFQKRKKRFYKEPFYPLFEEISESGYRNLSYVDTHIIGVDISVSMDRSYKKNIKFFLSDIGLSDIFTVSREKFTKTNSYCIRLSSKTSHGDFLVRKFTDGYFVVVSYRHDKIYKCDGIQGVKQVLYKVKKDINMKKKVQKVLDQISQEWDLKRQRKNNY